MAVVAKTGILGRGTIRTESGTCKVRRTRDGWYSVLGPASEESGRVRYDDVRDIIELDRPEMSLSIQFRPEIEGTTFEFNRYVYTVASMALGHISIKEGIRSVVEGRVTVSGVRLNAVAAHLQPVERELAFGLALRSNEVAKTFRQADRVTPTTRY